MSKCEHGKRKSRCKECGGASICDHGRIKSTCKECGGSSICEHGRIKSQCKYCGGASICEHGRQKSRCKECGGSQICEHGRQKSECKECGGSQICEHGKRKSQCKECGGSQICEHEKRKSLCKECCGSSFCEHGRQKSRCKECGGSQICEHNKAKSHCIQCMGSQICIHDKIKARCYECRGNQICKGQENTCTQLGNKNYKGYCTFCFSNLFPDDPLALNIRAKSKELKVRDFINENYEDFIHDKPIIIGDGCDCTNRRRIDFRKIIGNTMLAIEVDEFQHKRYDPKDEEARYNDMAMIFTGKWYYIRYNPDSYRDANNIIQNPDIYTRLAHLKKTIDKAINIISNDKNEELIIIEYIYYDEKNDTII
jgi:hypothetical protein